MGDGQWVYKLESVYPILSTYVAILAGSPVQKHQAPPQQHPHEHKHEHLEEARVARQIIHAQFEVHTSQETLSKNRAIRILKKAAVSGRNIHMYSRLAG